MSGVKKQVERCGADPVVEAAVRAALKVLLTRVGLIARGPLSSPGAVALVFHPARLLHERERALLTGIGTTRWRELEAAGKAPSARRVGSHRRWQLGELVTFLEQQDREFGACADPAERTS